MSPRNGVSNRNSRPFKVQTDDWYCTNKTCENLNFARRSRCNLCGKPKPYSRSRSRSRTKSRSRERDYRRDRLPARSSHYSSTTGKFGNPDDWECGLCHNSNWARRELCNMCGAPRRSNRRETRTGLGGGFNERDNVEYKKKRESDDEYDDFGRKRRKRENDKSVFKR